MRQITFLLIILIAASSCHRSSTLFNQIDSNHSGIHFTNSISENDSINPLDLEFLYNGGGVAVGDFNRDSLPDLYFTASTSPNRLYLNKGKLRFIDITETAKVGGNGEWSNAATVTDINNDGWPDLYVCASIYRQAARRTNLLYVNQGLNSEGVPVFKEMAAEYGLADTSYSVQAAFLDYDHDGDLDLYLATTRLAKREGARLNDNSGDSSPIDQDKLFKNDWNASLNHPVFTDVTKASGITGAGFGLSVSIADFNNDRWPDIYVANDFFSSDALYINQHDGSFSNKIRSYFRHTSQNAMGNDVADINNDGLNDIITVDMNPEDNYRKKKNMNGANYFAYQEMMRKNMVLQYVRNTLQLNLGNRVNGNDSIGDPVFADISLAAGVAQTDWSWSPSLADFDNDGFRDLLITNGYPRDVTDHDFVAFRSTMSSVASKEMIIDEIPRIRIPNYAFRNTGKLRFENVTGDWGLQQPSFSCGSAYADLDGDGDLDYVLSTINEEALLYENIAAGRANPNAYLTIAFKGPPMNRSGIGAKAELYYQGKMQILENQPVRGYLSCIEPVLHFGLGKTASIDSVIIRWPAERKKQVFFNVKSNSRMVVDFAQSPAADSAASTETAPAFFTDQTSQSGLSYHHMEKAFIDFHLERLLPHKLSEFGPGLAAGDVNGDSLDDVFIGGNMETPGTFLLQQRNGTFKQSDLPAPARTSPKESRGVLLFDADGDGDNDLYCASGSNEFAAGSSSYRDLLYINDGRGNFKEDSLALPENLDSKSCVKAADFDNDGDLDIFVGGRIVPGKYSAPASSRIYRNDSRKGEVKFTDVTATACKDLMDLGMVCDAIWSDFDNDGHTDLIVAGEWMPVCFFRNTGKGLFENVSSQSGIADQPGWWNSITGADLDNDGDIDYVIGNQGNNSFFQPSPAYPVSLYSKDFDRNGSIDPVVTVFLKDSTGKPDEFTWAGRDELLDQIPSMKKKFLTYRKFAEAKFSDVFSQDDLKDARVLRVTTSSNCVLLNDGGTHFSLIPLPVEAQLAPVFSTIADDIDGDGHTDLVLSGNDYGNEVLNGRYDAFTGMLLLGNGDLSFRPQTMMHSGISLMGDCKSLIKLRGPGNSLRLMAAEHLGPLKLYQRKQALRQASFTTSENYALMSFSDGRFARVERYWGGSFLSASSAFFLLPASAVSIKFYNRQGNTRTISF